MKTRLAILGLSLVVAFPLLAQKKEDERLANSATVMKELLQGDKGLPTNILNQAMCVLVFPSVKKVAIGIGGELIPKKAIQTRQHDRIHELARRFLSMVKEARAARAL